MHIYHFIPSDLPPPNQGDARQEDYDHTPEGVTATSLENREPQLQPQSSSDVHGTYELIDPNPCTGSTPREKFSLIYRPDEDMYLGPSCAHTSRDHEAPPPLHPLRRYILLEVAPTLPYPPMWYGEQLLVPAYPMPEYGGFVPRYKAAGTCDSSGTSQAKSMPIQEFRPVQHQEQGPTSTSLRAESCSQQSRRLRLERVAPIPSRAARSGQQGSLTLAEHMKRTQENDLGYHETLGQSTTGCLPVPPQGRSTPLPTLGAHGGTGRKKTKETKIPRPPGMPKAIRIGTEMYGCPYAECNETFTNAYDVARHYWEHLPVRVKWTCTLCSGTYTRSYNALRHFRKAHRLEGPREGEIAMDWPPTEI